jgi:hypothetical protein
MKKVIECYIALLEVLARLARRALVPPILADYIALWVRSQLAVPW